MTDEINAPFSVSPLPKMRQTSYASQVTRAHARDDRLPLLPVDADMQVHADAMNENARRSASRRFAEIDPNVVER